MRLRDGICAVEIDNERLGHYDECHVDIKPKKLRGHKSGRV